jgi:hypothetical protein
VLNPEIQVGIVQAHIDSGALQMNPPENKSYIAKSHKTQSTSLELILCLGLIAGFKNLNERVVFMKGLA